MRIQQLNLLAFGTFTDKLLDFSHPQGFHIIYGANETGKSTTLRALLALLFGIPERTNDAYLHNNDQLRIRATLRHYNTSSQEYQCVRRKGRKNTLLDAQNLPLDENLISELLGGISQEQFTALFCLDHERLVKGGESLLSSDGGVGESLFEAGTGTQQLHDLLKELDAEAEDLFKVGARASKPKLNRLIKSYDEKKKQLRTHSISVTDWNKKDHELTTALELRTQILEQLKQFSIEKQKIIRTKQTKPLLKRHQDIETALKQYQHTILLPEEAKTQRIEESLKLQQAQTQIQQSEQIIAELQQQQQQIQLQPEFLEHKIQIEQFRERLGSHQKAARDLPGVRTEMRTLENEAYHLLQRFYPNLSFENIPRVSHAQREKIKNLADKFPILQTQLAHEQERLERSKNEVMKWQLQHQDLAQLIDLTRLKSVLEHTLKQGDLETWLLKENKEVRFLTVKIEVALKQLGLWTGSLEELEILPVPSSERIDFFEKRFKELENDKQWVKEKLREARQRYTQAMQNIEALHWAGEIPTEDKLQQVRQQREYYWQELKRNPSLLTELIQKYERAVKEADEIADRLRRESHRVTQQANFKAEQQIAAREQEVQVKKWNTLKEMILNVQSEWEEAWKICNIKPWSPIEMRKWLNDCLNLRNQLSMLRERQQQQRLKQQLYDELSQQLIRALQELSLKPMAQLSELIVQATATLQKMTELQRQYHEINTQIKTHQVEWQRGELALQQLTQQLEQWQSAWANALIPLEIAGDTVPETVRDILKGLDDVLVSLNEISKLRRRIERMEEDAKNFQQEINLLLEKIAPAWLNEPIEHVIHKLSNQLNQIENDTARFSQLQQQLHVEQRELQAAKIQQNQSQAILQSLLEQAHCTQLIELEQAELDSIHKRKLLQAHSEVAQQLSEQGDGLSLIELANQAESVDIDQLSMQLQQIDEQMTNLEAQRSEFEQKIAELRVSLKHMDGNATAAEVADETQLYTTEIKELSERYLHVVTASFVLKQVIEKYRKNNQDPLLQRASELFRRLTLGSFIELKTGYAQDDHPILLGLRTPQSLGIPTAGMSEGTRDQLYLALRLASIERYLRHNTPIPLIFDDILVNFDDERARATLEILSQLSEKTQILFFTHHLRLVELAQKSIGRKRVMIHELGEDLPPKNSKNPQLSVF